MIGERWDVSVCRAVRGRNGPFDEDADEREEVDSSDKRDAFLDSRSIIYLSAFPS